MLSLIMCNALSLNLSQAIGAHSLTLGKLAYLFFLVVLQYKCDLHSVIMYSIAVKVIFKKLFVITFNTFNHDMIPPGIITKSMLTFSAFLLNSIS